MRMVRALKSQILSWLMLSGLLTLNPALQVVRAAPPKDIADTIESLLQPANRDKLTSILNYHVVGAKATSADIIQTQRAVTLQSQMPSIAPTLDEAQVIYPDIPCSNGVIHVIDKVMLPK